MTRVNICIFVALFSLVFLDVSFGAAIPKGNISPTSITATPNQQFTFTVSFDNIGDAIAYGPFLDVLFPYDPSVSPSTGVNVNTATSYLGISIQPVVMSFTTLTPCFFHPYLLNSTGGYDTVCSTPGTKLYSYRLPFLSYASSQPTIDLSLTASIAQNSAIISVRGGFTYVTPDKPVTQASLISPWKNSTVSASVAKPTLTFSSSTFGTDPSTIYSCFFNLNFASGTLVVNGTAIIWLPCGVRFIGFDAASTGKNLKYVNGSFQPDTGFKDQITVDLNDNPNATVQLNNVYVAFQFYFSYDDVAQCYGGGGSGAPIIVPWSVAIPYYIYDPTCNCVKYYNPGTSTTTSVSRFAIGRTMVDPSTPSTIIPGDTLQNKATLSFYLNESRTCIDSVVWAENGMVDVPVSGTASVKVDASTLTFTPTVDGSGDFTYSISDELAISPLSPPYLFEASYRTTIDATADRTHGATISAVSDFYFNEVNCTTGAIVKPIHLTASNSLRIASGKLTMTQYAKDGTLCNPCTNTISPTTLVTVSVKYTLPISTFKNLKLDIYMPYPPLPVATMTFDDVISAAPPALYHCKFGSGETLRSTYDVVPTVSSDATNNRVTLTYPDYFDESSSSTTAQILCTFQTADTDFPDELPVAAQMASSEQNVGTSTTYTTYVLSRPVIDGTGMYKGFVASNNPLASLTTGSITFNAPGTSGSRWNAATTPITSTYFSNNQASLTSSVSQVDANDFLTVIIVINNQGSSSAYDVKVSDAIPAGLAQPSGGYNMRVTNGAGAVLTTSGDLFSGGLTITNGANPPMLGKASTTGANIIVITYDLQINSISPGYTITVDAVTLLGYAAYVGGSQYSTNYKSGTITIDGAVPSIQTPVLVSSSLAETGSSKYSATYPDFALGESFILSVTLKFPEGTTKAAYFEFDFPTVATGVIKYANSTVNYGDNVSSATSTVTSDASSVHITFGDVTNTADDVVSVKDEITVLIAGVVVGTGNAQSSTVRTSTGLLQYGIQNSAVQTLTTTFDCELVEPVLTITRTWTMSSTSNADDTITMTIVVSHNSGSTNSAAFNLNITDALGAYLISNSDATASMGTIVQQDPLQVSIPVFTIGSTTTITYTAKLISTLELDQQVSSTASLAYYSVPDASLAKSYSASSTTTQNSAIATFASTLISTSLSETTKTKYSTSIDDLAIGETATIQSTITLPEGKISSAVVTFKTPQSNNGVLEIVSARIYSVGTSISGSPTPAVNQAATITQGSASVPAIATWNLGTLTNTPDNIADANDKITVEVVVKPTVGKTAQSSSVRTTTIALASSLTTTTVNAIQFEIVEAVKTIARTTTMTTSSDGHDLIDITLTVASGSSDNAAAYQTIVSDDASSSMTLVVGSVSVTGASSYTVQSGNTAGDTSLSVLIPTILSGASNIVITYRARIVDDIQAATSVVGTGTMTYYSNSDTGATNAKSYTQTASNTVVSKVPSIAIAVASTSLSETGADPGNSAIQTLAIGETISYTITLTLQEGSLSSTQVTFTASQVATGTLEVIAANVSFVGSSITGNPPSVGQAATISTGGLGSNSIAKFTLGNLLNDPDNTQNTQDTIQFIVVCRSFLNLASQTGNALTNTAALAYGSSGSASVTSQVKIYDAVPLLISKTSNIGTSVDGGDIIAVTLTIQPDTTSSNLGPAYSIVVNDLLAPDMSVVVASATTNKTGAVIATGPTSKDLQVSIPVIQKTDPAVRITYNVAVDSQIEASSVSMQAKVQSYTSPDITNSKTYTVQTSTVSATVPTISTSIALVSTTLAESGSDSSNALIENLFLGEVALLRLTVQFPEGNTSNAAVNFTVPQSAKNVMEIVSSKVASVGANLNSDVSISVNQAGTDTIGALGVVSVTQFNFGNIYNAPDNTVSSADKITIELRVRFANGQSNEPTGTAVTVSSSTSSLRATSSNSYQFKLVDTTQLSLIKAIPLASIVDACDIITANITVSPASSAATAAYNIMVIDELGPYVTVLTNTITKSDNNAVVTVSGTSVVIQLGVLSGSNSLIVTYQVQAIAQLEVLTTITSKANMTYYSNSDIQNAKVYQVTSPSYSSTTSRGAVSSSVTATSHTETTKAQYDTNVDDLILGETATVTYVVTFAEGRTTGSSLTVVSSEATGRVVEIVSMSVLSVGSKLSSSVNLATATATLSEGTVTGVNTRASMDLGNVLNTADNTNNANDQMRVTVVLRFWNSLSATQTGGDALTTITFNSDAYTDSTTTALELLLTKPLIFTKTAVGVQDGLDEGDKINITIVISRDSESNYLGPAYKISITDDLSSQLVVVPGSFLTSNADVTKTESSAVTNTVEFDLSVLLITDSDVVITYLVTPIVGIRPNTYVSSSASYYYQASNVNDATSPSWMSQSSTYKFTSALISARTSTDALAPAAATYRDPDYVTLSVGQVGIIRATFTLPEGNTTTIVITVQTPTDPDTLMEISSAKVYSSGSKLSSDVTVVPVVTNPSTAYDSKAVFSFNYIYNQADNIKNANDEFVLELRVIFPLEISSNIQPCFTTFNLTSDTYSTSTQAAFLPAPTSDLLLARSSAMQDYMDAGDLFSATLTVFTASDDGSDTYNVRVTDVLSGLVYEASSAQFSEAESFLVSDPNDFVSELPFRPYNSTEDYVIQYELRVGSEVEANTQISAFAMLHYRSGNDTELAKNVSLSTRTFLATTASPTYSFQVSTMLPETSEVEGVHQVTFGETATATFTITFTEGRTSNSQISVFASQVTSAVVEILSLTITHVGSKISSSEDLSTVEATLIKNTDGVNTNATLFLGNILNTYDNVVDDNDKITVEVVFRSVPDANETSGVVATNMIQFDSQTITHQEQFSMVLVDSHFTITETTSANDVAAGDIIYFTITVSPIADSNGPLYDITISENLPDQLNLASASDSVLTNLGNVVTSLRTDKFTVVVPIWTPADSDIVVYAACTVSKPSITGSDFNSTGATFTYKTAPADKTSSFIERDGQADGLSFFTAPSTFILKEADSDSRQEGSVFLLEIGQVFLMQAEIIFARGVSSNTTLTLALPNDIVGALQPIESMINFTGPAVDQIQFDYELSDSNNDGIEDMFTVFLGDVMIVGNNETQPIDSLVVITFATIVNKVSRDTGAVLIATLDITFSGKTSTDSLSLQIVEPVTTSSTEIVQIDQLFEIDDTFTTVVTLQHDIASHSPLYEIVIQLAGNTSGYQILNDTVTTSIDSIVTVDSNTQTIYIAKYDLEANADLIVTFDCIFVEATVGTLMETGIIVTGKSSAPHTTYSDHDEAITYNLEESYRYLDIKRPDVTIFVFDPKTGERLDKLELPVSGEGYIKALIYVPKSLVPDLSVHFELDEQLALKDGELITIQSNTTLYIGGSSTTPLEQIFEAGINVENNGTRFSIAFNGSIDVPEHQAFIEVTFPVVRLNTDGNGNSSTSVWLLYPGMNGTTAGNETRTIIPSGVVKSIEPELTIIVTKVDPVVIEKPGENATINLLILHTPRSTYTAFLVNFKLILPDIYDFVLDTVVARVDNETLDIYVNGSELVVKRDYLNLNERIAIEFVAIGYNQEFSSTSSLSNVYCSYTTTSDTNTQFSVYNQLSVYRKIQIAPDIAVLGPLSYFPTDDIALSPLDQVGASNNLPLLSTSNDNSSFIALSFDLRPIKSYFAHIHQLALVLPIASTEGQFSDSQLHIHVSSIGDYVWDENTADFASMVSVSPRENNNTLQVGEISLPTMINYVQIDLDRALIVLNENQTKVNLLIHASEGADAAKLTIFSKESSANKAARLIIEFERPPEQTCQQFPTRNSDFGSVTWLTGDLCLPSCHATSSGLICDPTVPFTPANDHKNLMPLFSSESSIQGGALRFVLKLPLSALPVDDSVTFQFKLGNEKRASAVYAYPGVLWTTRVVNATESDLGEAQWILEVPWKLALTAGWNELVDKKYNRHVWSTNLTILIDEEHVWRYPVEVQVPEVPQLSTVFSTSTTSAVINTGSVTTNSTGIVLGTSYVDFAQLKLVVPITSFSTNSSLLEIVNSTISDEWSLSDTTDYSLCVNTTACTQTFNLLIPLEQELPSTNHTLVSVGFEVLSNKRFIPLTIDFNFGASNVRSVVTLHWDYEGNGEVLNKDFVPESVFTVFESILVHVHVDQLPLNRSVFVQGVLDQTLYDSLALVIENKEYVLIENGQVTPTGQQLQLQVVSQTETDVTVSLSFVNSDLIANNETQATIVTGVLTEQLHQLNFTQRSMWSVYTAHNITLIIPPSFDDGVVAPIAAGLDVILPAVIVPGVVLLLLIAFLIWFALIAAGQCYHYCLQY